MNLKLEILKARKRLRDKDLLELRDLLNEEIDRRMKNEEQ